MTISWLESYHSKKSIEIKKFENLVVALVNKTSFGIKQSHIIWFLLDKEKNIIQKCASHDTCRIRVVEEDTIALKTDRVETRYLPLCSNPTEFGFKLIGILLWKSDKGGAVSIFDRLDYLASFSSLSRPAM